MDNKKVLNIGPDTVDELPVLTVTEVEYASMKKDELITLVNHLKQVIDNQDILIKNNEEKNREKLEQITEHYERALKDFTDSIKYLSGKLDIIKNIASLGNRDKEEK